MERPFETWYIEFVLFRSSLIKLFCLVFLAVLMLGACYDFNNPVDPNSNLYIPDAPRVLIRWKLVYNGDVQVLLSWVDESATETGFCVEQKIGAGAYTEIAASPAPARDGVGQTVMYWVTGLNAETDYWFRVCAVGAFGSTDYSNEVAAATGPNAPSGLNAVPSAGQVDLSRVDNTTVETGYAVEWGSDVVGYDLDPSVGVDSTGWSKSGLSAGTYYFRVIATGSNGNSSVSSGPVVVP